MRIRQSDLTSAQRCYYQFSLRLEEEQGTGKRGDVNSMTAFGTVMHYAIQVLETLHHEDRPDALDVAVATLESYWKPDNLPQLVPGGIDFWLPRTTYGGLLIRGRKALRDYFDLLARDDGKLLALEYQWEVPYELDGELHELHGTADRLALRLYKRQPYLSVEDFKTGNKPQYLRRATQWTVYSYASTRPEFWSQFQDLIDPVVEKLHAKELALWDDGSGYEVIARRGRWINLGQGDTVSIHDAGWRTEHDYARMRVQLRHFINANKAGVFPLTLSGDTCEYCPYARNGACGGVPIPELTEGVPDGQG